MPLAPRKETPHDIKSVENRNIFVLSCRNNQVDGREYDPAISYKLAHQDLEIDVSRFAAAAAATDDP